MAKDLTPDAWIASFAQSAGTVSFPLASVTGLTSGDCNASTGDIRRVLLTLMETLLAHQATLVGANIPASMVLRRVPTVTYVEYQIRVTSVPATYTLPSDT